MYTGVLYFACSRRYVYAGFSRRSVVAMASLALLMACVQSPSRRMTSREPKGDEREVLWGLKGLRA